MLDGYLSKSFYLNADHPHPVSANMLFVTLDLTCSDAMIHTWHALFHFLYPVATLSNLRHGLNCARQVKRAQLTDWFKQCLGLMDISAENDSRRRSGFVVVRVFLDPTHACALLPFMLFSEFQV